MRTPYNPPSRKPAIARVWLPMVVLLIASLSCSFPGLDRTTPTLEPTRAALPGATEPAAPSAAPLQAEQPATQATDLPQTDLPPAVIEVNPPPSSALAPGESPVFYFNQPMERASVEDAILVDGEPAQNSQIEWIDDSALRFLPDADDHQVAGLDIRIDDSARAANGQTLPAPIEVQYQPPGLLNLSERLPAPSSEDVNPSSAVVVTFNRPVTVLGAEPDSLPAAFTLEPPALGRGTWLNTSTYIFYPEPALLGGTRYTVHIAPNLTAANGALLAGDASADWSFTTSRPELISVQPTTERPYPLDSSFTLSFNQPMDTASVESNFSLLNADGLPVEGQMRWNDTATEAIFTPGALLNRGENYNLVLIGSASSIGGAEIGQNFEAFIVTVPQFAVTQTRPAAGEMLTTYSGYSTVFLTFSAPIAAGQDLEGLVSISPSVVDFSVDRDFEGETLIVSAYFEPSTSYTLTVAPQLHDRWDATLDVPYVFTFSTQPAEPSLMISARQLGLNTVFIPQDESVLPARATNITQLNLQSGSLPLRDFLQAASQYPGLENWQSFVQADWTVPFNQASDFNEEVNIPLTSDRSPLPAGLYFLHVNTVPTPESGVETTPTLLVVSPVQMVMKTSARQVFVWAVNTSSQNPIENALINIYNSRSEVLTSCTTGTDGSCQANLPVQDDPYDPLYAVLGVPGDADFSLTSSHWNQGIGPWEYGIPMANKGDRPEVYLYTDRPIYRPGQNMHFRLVARSQDNTRYSPPPVQQLTVEIVSPYDPLTNASQVLTTLPLTLDAFGTAHGTYSLPDDARPGEYVLRVQGVEFQDTRFTVAAYRKPEIDLQAQFAPTEMLAGSDLQAEISARYFFGAPAGNLPLRWTLFRAAAWADLPDGLRAGPVDLSWMDPYSGPMWMDVYTVEGQAQTAPDGTLSLTIPWSDLREHLGDFASKTLTWKLEVTIEDEAGLPVSARAEARQHPAPYYIGARSETWTSQSGEEITYTIRTLDWAANPVSDRALSAVFSRVAWDVQESTDPTLPPITTMQKTEVGSTDFRTSAAGDARLAFTPTEPGTYMLEITGEEGAVTQLFSWVGGAGTAPWPQLPNQRLELSADRGGSQPGSNGAQAGRYAPGETARIFIPNPFADGALALVTIERGKVMRSSVMRIQGASHELEVPVSADFAPNAYVSVTLLGRTGGRPDFRVGYIELEVDPSEHALQVELQTSPAQPQPGADVTLTLRAKDAQDNPVQGSFSLALVDKAVLALAEPNSLPILEAFYGQQPLGVQSSLSLVAYAGRMVYSPPGRGGGGGGMDFDTTLRSRFEDTAYWNGSLQTDVTGIAQVTFTLPDNLTTWHVDARGLDAETRVGQAAVDMVVSKPLLLVPVTPRFAVAGDHLELAAVVHNNTSNTLRAGVRLETAGFTLDEPNEAVQAVEILPGDQLRVSWWGTVQNVDALDLAFSVDSTAQENQAALHDAARPEGGLLPVLRYSSPQTFGTSGLITEAEERLELVSLPKSFTPTGGTLHLELAPSLAAVMLDGLQALDQFPYDFTEPTLSRLLPNLAALQALREFELQDEALNTSLEAAISDDVGRLLRLQNGNGSWGWAAGYGSDPYISSYALLGLSRASRIGTFVEPQALQRAQEYLTATLFAPSTNTDGWQLDRLAFQHYALLESGRSDINLSALYDLRDALSPWGKAFLAMSLDMQTPGDERARTLVSDLASTASRSASGANWQDENPNWHNWSTPNFTTAVVSMALARIDPDSQVLNDALRYLVMHRGPNGAWGSSYETAWSLLALIEALRGTGDLQASYAYSASLNDTPVINGLVENAAQAVNPVEASISIDDMHAELPNALEIQRGEGEGRLYYRAFLRVDRPAEQAPAVQQGMAISRRYYLAGQDCRAEACTPLEEIDLDSPQPVQVRLTLTVPEDMYYVMVEDIIPAGSEVLNPRLRTSQQNVAPVEDGAASDPLYNQANPFSEGWGWWRFNDPQVFDNRVRWVVDFLPAGTYELTYRITPYLAGEFQVLPARAWQYYFPDVQAASRGEVVIIR